MAADGASGAAGAALGWKLIGGLAGMGAVGAGLATIVVMCMTPPRSRREWAVALITTVMFSICGGSAAIEYLNLHLWVFRWTGQVALLGMVFACGLPGWAIVRWIFNWMAKREGKDITEVIEDAKADLKAIKG